MNDDEPPPASLTRRSFLRGGALVGLGATAAAKALPVPAESSEAEAELAEPRGRVRKGPQEITLSVNGEQRPVTVEPRTSLVNALRVHMQPPLTGTKLVCDGGNCGACTVMLDGEPAAACMVLALDAENAAITTVEGLGYPLVPTRLQQNFCDHDALMCGFCTSGFIVAISAELARNPKATDEQLAESCSGNLCRCGTYPQIMKAAISAVRGAR